MRRRNVVLPGAAAGNGSAGQTPPPARPDDTASHAAAPHEPAPNDDTPTIISSQRTRSSPDLGDGLAGRRLGHFELIESIGVGGMAAVIKAHDLDLGRTVALKILPPDMAADPENVTRFKHEARAAAKLDHENVARVYFCGEDQGLHFIAFEFVEGDNLRSLLDRRGPLPAAECVHYMIQVATGLGHAASRGVVHRDIKPSNIIITPEGRAKIVDMGLARNLDPHSVNGGVTQSGVTLGTFDYISPEQALEPRQADVRSDIYSLGCTFYHVLTGRPPVPDGTAAKKLHFHQHVHPIDPRQLNPDVPDELAAVLAKMMAKDPAQRYQTPEHLLQHLVALAQHLHIATDGLPSELSGVRAVDTALPGPPRLSPWWVGLAAAGLVVGVVAVTGGFGGPPDPIDAPPLWNQEKSGPAFVGPVEPPGNGNVISRPAVGPEVPVPGPQEARTSAELLALLRQGAPHIRLTGDEYDLTGAGSMKPGELPVFQGADLVLEGSESKPPRVRVAAAPRDDGETPRPGTLRFRGPAAGPSRVTLRDLRFEVAGAADGTQPTAGVCFYGVDRVKVERCSFGPAVGEEAAGAVAVVRRAGSEEGPRADFEYCYFARGSVAVLAVGRVAALASECVFAPQSAVFRVRDTGMEGADEVAASIRLNRCSALLESGAVVELDDRVPCRIVAGRCLFSAPDPESRGVLVRQLGTRARGTSYSGFTGPEDPISANGYHNLVALAVGGRSLSFEDCKAEDLPVSDSTAVLLDRSPWQTQRPLDLLAGNDPDKAFQRDMQAPKLRLGSTRQERNNNILGADYFVSQKLYNYSPLPDLPPADTRLARQKVWKPDLLPGEALPPGVYRSLQAALDDLQSGDELLVQHNGELPIEKAGELARAGTRITIKPAPGFRPVLVFNNKAGRKYLTLFRVLDGRLIFQDLQFRLAPVKPSAEESRAAVTMAAGGQCEFRHCVLTLEDAACVRLSDLNDEMKMGTQDKWPVPQLRFENSFVRGKGGLLAVPSSRPFELDIQGGLAVLDGSLLDVRGNPDANGATPSQVRLSHLTTYLTGHLVSLQGVKKGDVKGPGLARTDVQAGNCLFAPANGTALAFVRADRVDNETQMKDVFSFRGAQNEYGYSPQHTMLEILPENAEAMPIKPFDADRWVAFALESGKPFAKAKFAVVPESRTFTGVRPSDFRVKSFDPPLKPEDPADYGADVGALPRPYEEERPEPQPEPQPAELPGE